MPLITHEEPIHTRWVQEVFPEPRINIPRPGMVVCDCTARDQYLVASVPTQIVWSLVNLETGELMLNGVDLPVLINYLNAERLQELEAE